ncbi:hypothetical protein HMN09_00575600 [Mycena chlorophos]|uniref:Uncharacterized protein n=1 Tax=Mycena chlorophos TaxID=658473 RepID=A0A8H6WGN2_MYCCL|nr:hypothetical protein HMN09_00575600 [Mycena chlorophos]
MGDDDEDNDFDGDDDEAYIDPSLDQPYLHSAFGGAAAQATAANQAAVAAGSCLRHRFPPHMREGHTTVRLFEWLQSGKIDLQAEYQRQFVWQAPAQMSLVDSLLRGAPVNQLMFSESPFLFFRSCLTQRRREVHGEWHAEAVMCRREATVNELMALHGRRGARLPFSLFSFPADSFRRFLVLRNPEDRRSYYYTNNGTHRNAKLLPAYDRRAFDNTTISCLIFEHLAPTEERDIFQRVQQGKPLTNAEKLRSIDTPRSRLIRTLETSFLDNESSPLYKDVFKTGVRAAPYRSLAQVVGATALGSLTSMGSGPEKWLRAVDDVPADLEKEARETLRIFERIHSSTDALRLLAPAEFVGCGYFVQNFKGTRTLERLVEGIRRVTGEVRRVHTGNIKANLHVFKTMETTIAAWALDGTGLRDGEVCAVDQVRGVAQGQGLGADFGEEPSLKRKRDNDGEDRIPKIEPDDDEPEIVILDGPPPPKKTKPTPSTHTPTPQAAPVPIPSSSTVPPSSLSSSAKGKGKAIPNTVTGGASSSSGLGSVRGPTSSASSTPISRPAHSQPPQTTPIWPPPPGHVTTHVTPQGPSSARPGPPAAAGTAPARPPHTSNHPAAAPYLPVSGSMRDSGSLYPQMVQLPSSGPSQGVPNAPPARPQSQPRVPAQAQFASGAGSDSYPANLSVPARPTSQPWSSTQTQPQPQPQPQKRQQQQQQQYAPAPGNAQRPMSAVFYDERGIPVVSPTQAAFRPVTQAAAYSTVRSASSLPASQMQARVPRPQPAQQHQQHVHGEVPLSARSQATLQNWELMYATGRQQQSTSAPPPAPPQPQPLPHAQHAPQAQHAPHAQHTINWTPDAIAHFLASPPSYQVGLFHSLDLEGRTDTLQRLPPESGTPLFLSLPEPEQLWIAQHIPRYAELLEKTQLERYLAQFLSLALEQQRAWFRQQTTENRVRLLAKLDWAHANWLVEGLDDGELERIYTLVPLETKEKWAIQKRAEEQKSAQQASTTTSAPPSASHVPPKQDPAPPFRLLPFEIQRARFLAASMEQRVAMLRTTADGALATKLLEYLDPRDRNEANTRGSCIHGDVQARRSATATCLIHFRCGCQCVDYNADDDRIRFFLDTTNVRVYKRRGYSARSCCGSATDADAAQIVVGHRPGVAVDADASSSPPDDNIVEEHAVPMPAQASEDVVGQPAVVASVPAPVPIEVVEEPEHRVEDTVVPVSVGDKVNDVEGHSYSIDLGEDDPEPGEEPVVEPIPTPVALPGIEVDVDIVSPSASDFIPDTERAASPLVAPVPARSPSPPAAPPRTATVSASRTPRSSSTRAAPVPSAGASSSASSSAGSNKTKAIKTGKSSESGSSKAPTTAVGGDEVRRVIVIKREPIAARVPANTSTPSPSHSPKKNTVRGRKGKGPPGVRAPRA